jgi:hypothetical protein
MAIGMTSAWFKCTLAHKAADPSCVVKKYEQLNSNWYLTPWVGTDPRLPPVESWKQFAALEREDRKSLLPLSALTSQRQEFGQIPSLFQRNK